MKKNFRLIFLLLVLISLIAITYIITYNPSSVLSKEALSDFAVEDTANIDKLIISNTEGQSVILVRKKKGIWTLEDGTNIEQDPIRTMLKTIKRIQVKSTIPKSSHETVFDLIIGTHQKVEIYLNSRLEKTYYVGPPTADHYGTYMLLETPDKGRSPEPFIMYLPGHNGHLSTRFFADPSEWKFSGIYNYDPLEIEEISITNHETPSESFTIMAVNNKDFKLIDHKGNPTYDFDSVFVRDYITFYKKVHYNFVEKGLTKEIKDSIINKAEPFRTIHVKTKEGATKQVVAYRRAPRKEDFDLEGNPIPFDRDLFIGVIDNKDWVVCQYYVFDKLFQNYSIFITE